MRVRIPPWPFIASAVRNHFFVFGVRVHINDAAALWQARVQLIAGSAALCMAWRAWCMNASMRICSLVWVLPS